MKAISSLSLLSIFALSLTFAATGCGSNNTQSPTATKQGTVNLEQLKVGMPETTFKEAIFTFVPDPKGSLGEKTQYLSRAYDANGGQVIAQCRNGQCYGLQIYHVEKPITKEAALECMKAHFPTDAPPQSRVDDKALKAGKDANPIEVYWFGDKYRGELIYTDKSGSQVQIVNTWQETAPSSTATSSSPKSESK